MLWAKPWKILKVVVVKDIFRIYKDKDEDVSEFKPDLSEPKL